MISELTKRPSAIVLILMNLLPLVGVAYWGWSVFNIVLLYWLENLVLGVINILKMLSCRPDVSDLKEMAMEKLESGDVPEEEREKWGAKLEAGGIDKLMMHGHSALKLFMIPFFTLHYFGFCAGHGFFVFAMFGEDGVFGGSEGNGTASLADPFAQLPNLLTGGLLLAVIGLVISHLYSFFSNYIGRGEYKRSLLPLLMFKPYGRIALLHIAILFGGFAVVQLGSSVGLLIILIIGKIIIDLVMHLREHRKADIPPDPRSPLLKSMLGGR